MQSLVAALSLGRMAAPEPYVFNGDSLKYTDWCATFDGLVGSKPIPDCEKLHYLKQYLGGPAKEAVNGLFLLNSDEAYSEARRVLRERYGSPNAICDAFRDKLERWPVVSGGDASSLRKFSDFLNQCSVASRIINGMGILSDERENKKMLEKLPHWVAVKWVSIVAGTRKSGKFPTFPEFVNFVATQADIVCDPLLAKPKTQSSLPKNSSPKMSRQAKTFATMQSTTPGADTLDDQSKSQFSSPCNFCKGEYHRAAECYTLASKPIEERKQFIEEERLCFACLRKGHMSRNCLYRRSCKKCKQAHPTALHEDKHDKKPHGNNNTNKPDVPEARVGAVH